MDEYRFGKFKYARTAGEWNCCSTSALARGLHLGATLRVSDADPVVLEFSARELDFLLRDYAFRAVSRPRTGVVYNGKVPANFTGVKVAALRLRSGSMRRKGFSRYKEFHIPVGLVEQPYVERVVLVYHNLANWSSLYYPLPGYTFLAPVLGLLAYDATKLSELEIRASEGPISIQFSSVRSGLKRVPPKCVYFGLDGSVGFDNVVKENTCLTTNQGHFSIVVESSVALGPTPSGDGDGGGGNAANLGGGKGRSTKMWMIVGFAVGVTLIIILLTAILGCVIRCRRRKKIQRMEEIAEGSVSLPMARVGYMKAPVASGTRTRPLLENEFVT
ncbi:hypothetical protein BUALT_Bualt13G0104900 [Buddleja alternifolia]|uniref:Uncharacterized protein n=1 Tax=Buddleja alternifolia TaxID=168488 RepID=A0AAV6WM26_9LAMI|nr:hypothetical protein BUALT_Bualt13G0104900 [Buddleja alternifolia]